MDNLRPAETAESLRHGFFIVKRPYTTNQNGHVLLITTSGGNNVQGILLKGSGSLSVFPMTEGW
jgi:hypothetical protein